jgi:hypothetical protein
LQKYGRLLLSHIPADDWFNCRVTVQPMSEQLSYITLNFGSVAVQQENVWSREYCLFDDSSQSGAGILLSYKTDHFSVQYGNSLLAG